MPEGRQRGLLVTWLLGHCHDPRSICLVPGAPKQPMGLLLCPFSLTASNQIFDRSEPLCSPRSVRRTVAARGRQSISLAAGACPPGPPTGSSPAWLPAGSTHVASQGPPARPWESGNSLARTQPPGLSLENPLDSGCSLSLFRQRLCRVPDGGKPDTLSHLISQRFTGSRVRFSDDRPGNWGTVVSPTARGFSPPNPCLQPLRITES